MVLILLSFFLCGQLLPTIFCADRSRLVVIENFKNKLEVGSLPCWQQPLSKMHLVLRVLKKSRFQRMTSCINFTSHLMNFFIYSVLGKETSSQDLNSFSIHVFFSLVNSPDSFAIIL